MRNNRQQRRRGAAMIEYALLIAGVTLVSAAATAVFGHKTNDLISSVAAVLPGAHGDDNAPIVSGKIIETAIQGADANAGEVGAIALDIDTILLDSDGTTSRLSSRLGTTGIDALIVEAE